MENLEECMKYFKEKEYKRIFSKMRKKYESYGKWEGNIIIENPTQEEKETLSGFMKKNYYKNKSITISIKKFEERLQETKFSNIPLKTIIENYYKKPLISKKQKEQKEKYEEAEFYNKILKENENMPVYQLIKSLCEEENTFFKKQYRKNKENLELAIKKASECFNKLPNEKTKLAVFSAKIIKTPHGLDRNTLTGQIFTKFLSMANNQKIPKETEELSELYFKNNLLIDDVSNMVLCKNIRAYTKKGEHLGWKGFLEEQEAIQATLENLSKIEKVETEYNYALVMENPAVFTAIADKLQDKKVPIVCTYGQVKLSGLVLLKLLSKTCKVIYYSGDIDPEGVQIADKLKSKFPETIRLIGFDKENYYKNLSNVEISNERLHKLDKIQNQELIEISDVIKKEKRASYEELKIDEIFNIV